MVCKNCGIANSDTSRFCSECGSVLPRPKPQEPAQQAPEAQLNPPTAQPAAYAVVPNIMTPPMPLYQPAVFDYNRPFAAQMHMPVYPAAPAPAPQPQAAAPCEQAQPAEQAAPVTAPEAQANAYAFGAQMPRVGEYPPVPSVMPPYMAAPLPYAQPPMPAYAYSPLYQQASVSKLGTALWMAIFSAALPLITFSFASPIGLALAIAAICMAGMHINKVHAQYKSKAIAGIVIGIVGLLISLFGCSVLFKAIGALATSEEFKRFSEQFNSFIAFVILKALKMTTLAVKTVAMQLQIIMRFLLLK